MSFQQRLKQAHADTFVGREAQLDLFQRNLAASIPPHPLLHISGLGGVGKSTLLGRFQAMCRAADVPHALTDGEVDKTAPQAMCRLATLLAALPTFYECIF